jgi:hypothetical protein
VDFASAARKAATEAREWVRICWAPSP